MAGMPSATGVLERRMCRGLSALGRRRNWLGTFDGRCGSDSRASRPAGVGSAGRIPGAQVNGDRARRVPNTTNMTFANAGGEALLIALDLQGIACSTGAACSSGSTEPSHVLLAAGLVHDDARSSLRFSLGRATTREEVERAIEVVPEVVERIRSLSPKAPVAAQTAAVPIR